METSCNCLTSVVFLASGSALQLPMDDDFDLLLEPHPTSILQVSLPGHTIFVVPEGLQDCTWPGHPQFTPSCPLGSAFLDRPRDLIVIQPEPSSASVRNSNGLQNVSPSGNGLLPAIHLSSSAFPSQVSDGWSPSASPGGESYASWSTRSPEDSMLEPLPYSPLESVPPSPPPSHQEQRPLSPGRPTRPPCKAKRRLLFYEKSTAPQTHSSLDTSLQSNGSCGYPTN